MRSIRADRWLVVGSTLASIGAAAAIGYWIYGLEATPPGSFWRLPGFLALGLVLLGLAALAVGFFKPAEAGAGALVQSGGEGSTNIQAGGDVSVGGDLSVGGGEQGSDRQ